ncbi:MAG: nitroreductase family protein [Thermoproteota archaeon]|jgi:nitroreductase|nr:nitroreductase family protein [Thermoproteota archaeon]
MEVYDYVIKKLDIREYSQKEIPKDIKLKILEAARSTGSGKNLQHWRFIVVKDKENLKKLADDSITGKWIVNANFAVIVLTDPKYPFHLIDAGRVVQNMQIAAWGYGIASCIFTGINKEKLRKDFNIPADLEPSVVVGFGYPIKKIKGKKNRKPLNELVSIEKYGNPFNPELL